MQQPQINLRRAILRGRVAEVREYVEQCGKESLSSTPCGMSALGIALAAKLPEMVRELLALGADVNLQERGPASGKLTILDRAITDVFTSDDLSSIRLLLEGGLDPNHADANGWTLLIRAVIQSIPLTKLILSHGADPNVVDRKIFAAVLRGRFRRVASTKHPC